MTCIARAYPPVSDIRWQHSISGMVIRNNNDLKPSMVTEDNNLIVINRVGYSDAGNYTCFASNGVLSKDKSTASFGTGNLRVFGE